MTVADDVREAIRLVQASERLSSLIEPIKTTVSMADRALEIAPELDPEIDAVKARLLELVDHVQAAGAVLAAKLDAVIERHD